MAAQSKSGTSLWGRLLKRTLNPLMLRGARSGRGRASMVTSIGRKSGKTYETPIIVQPTEGGFMIELTYGPEVQWHRNVRAAGGCTITYRGRPYAVDGFEQVDVATGLAAFPPAQRRILKLLRRTHFVRFLTS
jgi:deazaflavin-dependent oxidoreductase (nitroreductase family)